MGDKNYQLTNKPSTSRGGGGSGRGGRGGAGGGFIPGAFFLGPGGSYFRCDAENYGRRGLGGYNNNRGSHSLGEGRSGGGSGDGAQNRNLYEVNTPPRFETIQPKLLLSEDVLKPGTRGTAVKLLGNYFPLVTCPFTIHQYEVNIKLVSNDGTEELGNAFARVYPQIVDQYMQRYSHSSYVQYHHEGLTQLYVAGVPIWKFKFEHQIEGRKYRVNIKKVDRIDIREIEEYYREMLENIRNNGSEKMLAIYKSIIHYLLKQMYKPFNGKFFDLDDRTENANVALFDFVKGFVASVRLTEFGLALNLHLKTGVLIKDAFTCGCDDDSDKENSNPALCNHTLDRFVLAIIRNNAPPDDDDNPRILETLNESQVKMVSKILKGFMIKTRYGNRTRRYIIKRMIMAKPTDEETKKIKYLDPESGQTLDGLSVEGYFIMRYEIVNLKPYPLIEARSGRNDVLLPLERCYLLPDQFVADDKLDQSVLDEMANEASRVSTQDYFSKVVSRISEFNLEKSDFLHNFHMELITRPVQFKGRVLPLPQVIGPTSKQMVSGQRWCLLSLDETCTKAELFRFELIFRNEAEKMNLYFEKLPKDHLISLKNCTAERVENAFNNIKRYIDPHFMLIVIPNRQQPPPPSESLPPDDLYNLSKYFTDVRYQIVCQDLKGDSLKQIANENLNLSRNYVGHPEGGYLQTLLLSVNGKFGGKNEAVNVEEYIAGLPFKMAETMIVGVDVILPTVGERVQSSIAVAVGSTDSLMYNFSCAIHAQAKKREIIHDIEPMILELLEQYRKVKNAYPKSVILIRDSVSERQFVNVIGIELPRIRRALDSVGQEIKLTLIVVQKVHSARFALIKDNEHYSGRNAITDVPNGTVVDSIVCEPSITGEMMILNSHFSHHGTSHPTKYVLLFDGNHLSTDQLEMFCYFVCRNYIATNEVLSIPTPLKYANLCANQAKKHIRAYLLLTEGPDWGIDRMDEEDLIYYGDGEEREEDYNEIVKLGELSKKRMFYV